MKESQAITALAALAQASRLQVFRALVAAGPTGLAAGAIAEQLKIAPTSLSFHLKGLSHSGLIQSRAEGRFIFYSADYSQMNALMAYLTENCCGGNRCSPAGTSCAVATPS
jgi:DNA-binding transcriptional ArsR family regulator